METTKIMQHLIGKPYSEVAASLRTEEDHGDCCGYADSDKSDQIAEVGAAKDAILVDVIQISYGYTDEDRVVANFIFDAGDNKGLILGYDMTAGSGSGWQYGASCELYHGDDLVAGASW